MLPVSHESSISNSRTSVSHWEKYANSLSIEDEDPAPTMGFSATVTACMSQVKKINFGLFSLYMFSGLKL